jgi:hypothetical protein
MDKTVGEKEEIQKSTDTVVEFSDTKSVEANSKISNQLDNELA